MLFLSSLPCGDVRECDGPATTVITASTQDLPHQHSSEQCTPFCTCACCSITVSCFETTILTAEKTSSYTKIFPVYTAPFVKDIFETIWQPPKIS